MAREILVSGPSEEEALKEAIGILSVDRDAIEYEVSSESDDELLPGAKPQVEVRAWIRPEYVAEKAENCIRGILDRMKIDYEIDVSIERGIISLDISAQEDSSLLIGRDGQNLNALQYLVGRMAIRSGREAPMVLIDVKGYRKRQYRALERLVERAIERARETGNEIELDPMGPSTRKYLHHFIRDFEGVKTFSRGDEPDRYLVIIAD